MLAHMCLSVLVSMLIRCLCTWFKYNVPDSHVSGKIEDIVYGDIYHVRVLSLLYCLKALS